MTDICINQLTDYQRRRLSSSPATIITRSPVSAVKQAETYYPDRLYVKNLPFNLSSDQVHDKIKADFQSFGEVVDVRIVQHKEPPVNSTSRCNFAFITFAKPVDVTSILTNCADGNSKRGRKLTIDGHTYLVNHAIQRASESSEYLPSPVAFDAVKPNRLSSLVSEEDVFHSPISTVGERVRASRPVSMQDSTLLSASGSLAHESMKQSIVAKLTDLANSVSNLQSPSQGLLLALKNLEQTIELQKSAEVLANMMFQSKIQSNQDLNNLSRSLKRIKVGDSSGDNQMFNTEQRAACDEETFASFNSNFKSDNSQSRFAFKIDDDELSSDTTNTFGVNMLFE